MPHAGRTGTLALESMRHESEHPFTVLSRIAARTGVLRGIRIGIQSSMERASRALLEALARSAGATILDEVALRASLDPRVSRAHEPIEPLVVLCEYGEGDDLSF